MASEIPAHSAAESSEPNNSSSLTNVVYVMGAGRSGSTILGIALGNCDDFFFAGELDAWLRKSAVPNFGGEEREKFWAAVRNEVGEQTDLYGESVVRRLEHSTAVFDPRRRARRDLRARFRAFSERLYRQIAHESCRSFIVDTSHYPLRANELATTNGIDLYLLYLVRKPESVVASFQKKEVGQGSKSVLGANAYLWLTTLISMVTYLRHPPDRRLFVRYERLMADPEEVLRQILDKVGSTSQIPDLNALRTGIPFQGNRLLREDQIRLERGINAKAPASVVTTVLQLPWLLGFLILERVQKRSG